MIHMLTITPVYRNTGNSVQKHSGLVVDALATINRGESGDQLATFETLSLAGLKALIRKTAKPNRTRIHASKRTPYRQSASGNHREKPRKIRGEVAKVLDRDFLFQFPIKVVGSRQNDDLECALCLEYGPVVIVEIQDCTYDVCNRCAAAAGIVW